MVTPTKGMAMGAILSVCYPGLLNAPTMMLTSNDRRAIGNRPCKCGSGKLHKFCCGRKLTPIKC
jgi:hypothetical protein